MGGPYLSSAWPWSDLGQGEYWLAVLEFDKGDDWGYRFYIGWFVYPRHACSTVICCL